MAERYTTFVQRDNMLSILSGSDIEQPYRFQPYVQFIVPMSEYREFVQLMLDVSASWLRFEPKQYAKALRTKNQRLWDKLYLFDVSKAIISEVALAVRNAEQATVILHEFDNDVEAINLADVDTLLASVSGEAVKSALESLKRDIKYFISFDDASRHNKLLIHYAVLLRAMCFTTDIPKVNININE